MNYEEFFNHLNVVMSKLSSCKLYQIGEDSGDQIFSFEFKNNKDIMSSFIFTKLDLKISKKIMFHPDMFSHKYKNISVKKSLKILDKLIKGDS